MLNFVLCEELNFKPVLLYYISKNIGERLVDPTLTRPTVSRYRSPFRAGPRPHFPPHKPPLSTSTHAGSHILTQNPPFTLFTRWRLPPTNHITSSIIKYSYKKLNVRRMGFNITSAYLQIVKYIRNSRFAQKLMICLKKVIRFSIR